MTQQQLISQGAISQRLTKRLPWWVFACVSVSGVFAFIYLLVGLCILPFTDYFFVPLPLIALAVGVCALLFSALPVVQMLWERRLRKLGLVCPTCGKVIWNVSFQTAIDTGLCHYCGARIVDPVA